MWEIVSRGRTPYPGVQNCELLDLLRSGARLKAPPDCDPPLSALLLFDVPLFRLVAMPRWGWTLTFDPMSLRSYEVMRSCWDEDPGSRPTFRELLQMLEGLLAEFPKLEAGEEVTYINQVLEVLAAAAADSQQSLEPGGSRRENVYLCCPAAPADTAEQGRSW